MSVTARTTVLFDGDCGLCQWTVRQLRRLDRHRRLEFLPLQRAASVEARPDLAAISRRYALIDELHVVTPDGRVAAGGDAALHILDVLPGGWLLRPWARLGVVRTAVGIVYRAVADRRHRIGRLVLRGAGAPACAIDGASAAERASPH